MEEKTELIPTIEMNLAEKKDVLSKASGKALALNNFPDNTRWTMKILDEPKIYTDDEDETKKTAYWSVEFKHNGVKIPARIRTSHGAFEKVIEKYPDKEYIGRYAFFSHLKKGDKNIHSIGVFKTNDEPKEFVDPLAELENADQIKQESEVEVEPVEEEVKKEVDYGAFIKQFKEQVTEFNKMMDSKKTPEKKQPCNVALCQLQYFKKTYLIEYNAIQQQFGE